MPTSIKTTGAEWKRFYNDKQAWPEGAYHDDTVVAVDHLIDPNQDLSEVADNVILDVQGGDFYLKDGTHTDLVDYFSEWLKKQTTSCGVFESPKDKFEAVKAAILAAGGSLVQSEGSQYERQRS